MNRVFTCIGLFLVIPLYAWAQQPSYFSQYFQSAMTINPAITGTEEFLDLKLGYRQQWSGIEGAPESYFVSAHSPLSKKEVTFPYQNNSLRISDPNIYTNLQNSGQIKKFNPIRHGVGGYILSDQQGVFNQQSGFLSYALHITLSPTTTLALGVAGGVNSREIDVSNIKLGETEIPDPTYEAYLAQQGRVTNFDMNAGLFLYADKFYVGYAADRIFQNELYSSVENITGKQLINHFGLAGLRFRVNANLLIAPGILVKYNEVDPLLYDINLRFKFGDLAWVGASYRNTQMLAGMAGININDFINLSYSYDYGLADINAFSSNVHEIMLGFMLFNTKDVTPYLW